MRGSCISQCSKIPQSRHEYSAIDNIIHNRNNNYSLVQSRREKRQMQRVIALNALHSVCAGSGSSLGEQPDIQTHSTTSEDDALSVKQMKGYRVFKMDGCTFLVKELPDQRLDLNDILVIDDVTQESKPVELHDADIPLPKVYHEVEWASHFPGNDLEDKPPMRWVLKVFLVAVESTEPYRLDFDSTVYVLDAATGSISECPVTRLAPSDTPEELIQLRIRETGITIDRMDGLPCPETVVRSKLAGVPALSELEQQDVYTEVAIESSSGSSTTASQQQQDDEDDIMAYDEDEDDSLSDFLVEVDDDSDSEYDGDSGDFGDADGDDGDSGDY